MAGWTSEKVQMEAEECVACDSNERDGLKEGRAFFF